MAIPVWPPGLPQESLTNGYSENFPNNLVRYSGESKAVGKVRRRGATPPFTYKASFFLSLDQRDLLRNFVQYTLKDGALRFEFFHPIDRGVIEARIIPDGENLYTITPLLDGYTVTLNIEVLP
jgi:hypothetical protein